MTRADLEIVNDEIGQWTDTCTGADAESLQRDRQGPRSEAPAGNPGLLIGW